MIDPTPKHFFRFHQEHCHLHSPFGDDTFGKIAESFSNFMGTTNFVVYQTVVIFFWIVWNVLSGHAFDPFPFIFLNLAFSAQAAYATPFILFSAKREAERDKANSMADAKHREELAQDAAERQKLIQMLIEQNNAMTARIETLTAEVHAFTAKSAT